MDMEAVHEQSVSTLNASAKQSGQCAAGQITDVGRVEVEAAHENALPWRQRLISPRLLPCSSDPCLPSLQCAMLACGFIICAMTLLLGVSPISWHLST